MLTTVEEKVVVSNTGYEVETDLSRNARKVIDFYIDKGVENGRPFPELMTISPEIAQTLLNRNPDDENRKLSKVTVRKYATDMANGKWNGLNGQTIVVSKEGFLNDGQHRLNAILQSGVKIQTMVIFGAERDSRLTLDQNKVRTSGDYLGMMGVKNPNNIAAIATMLITYERDNFTASRHVSAPTNSGNRPTKAEIHEYATTHLKEIDRAFHAVSVGDHKLLAQPSRLAAAYAILERTARHKSDVATFFDAILYGEGLKRGQPPLTCRRRLMTERKNMPSVRETLETIFRAWNYFVQEKELFTVVLKGKFPELDRG